MSNYTLTEFKTVEKKVNIYKMMVDYICPFDDFEEDVINNHANMKNSFKKILYVIDLISRGLKPNPANFKLFNDYVNYKMFEIKHEKLRVYGIIEKSKNHIIISGGYKTNQKNDVLNAKKIIKDYRISLE